MATLKPSVIRKMSAWDISTGSLGTIRAHNEQTLAMRDELARNTAKREKIAAELRSSVSDQRLSPATLAVLRVLAASTIPMTRREITEEANRLYPTAHVDYCTFPTYMGCADQSRDIVHAMRDDGRCGLVMLGLAEQWKEGRSLLARATAKGRAYVGA